VYWIFLLLITTYNSWRLQGVCYFIPKFNRNLMKITSNQWRLLAFFFLPSFTFRKRKFHHVDLVPWWDVTQGISGVNHGDAAIYYFPLIPVTNIDQWSRYNKKVTHISVFWHHIGELLNRVRHNITFSCSAEHRTVRPPKKVRPNITWPNIAEHRTPNIYNIQSCLLHLNILSTLQTTFFLLESTNPL